MEKASPLEALLYTFSQVPDLEPPTNSFDRQFFLRKRNFFSHICFVIQTCIIVVCRPHTNSTIVFCSKSYFLSDQGTEPLVMFVCASSIDI